MTRKGFTLLESIIVVGIVALLFAMAFQASALLEAQSLIRSHRVVGLWVMDAAQRARSGVGGGDWGVYFVQDPVSLAVSELVLFQGSTYATRDTTKDVHLPLSESIVFAFTLQDVPPFLGSGTEIVFSASTGDPHQTGTVTLTTQDTSTSLFIPSSGVPTLER